MVESRKTYQFREPRTVLGNLTRHFPYTFFATSYFFLSLSLSFHLVFACVVPAYFIKLFPIFGIKACRQTKIPRTNRNAIQFYASINRESIFFTTFIQQLMNDANSLNGFIYQVKKKNSCAGSDCICQLHVKRAFDAKTHFG